MQLFYRNDIISFLANKLVVTLVLCILTNHLLFSQQPAPEKSNFLKKSYSEELYVKTDRDLYIAGEKVWLKVYKLNGPTHAPSDISKVVFIDFLGIDNNPVKQLKLSIDDNSGGADFRLPDTLSTGHYIIRSYTNWMKNFPKELFSYKRISVINPFKSLNSIKIPSRESIPDSIFFAPEGGHLINDTETRLGFRSTDINGAPIAMNGAIIYENNDTICYIKTGSDGYGWTTIKPIKHNKIFLVSTNKAGPVRKFALPEVMDEGITFSVTNKIKDSPIIAKIITSRNFNTAGIKLYLRLRSASFVNIKKEIIPRIDQDIDILKNDIPKGLSYVTIIDEHENLLANRWIYNEIEQQINYNIDIQKREYSTREKIKIDISAMNKEGVPIESDISISIVKAFTVNNNNFNTLNYRQLQGLTTNIIATGSQDFNDYLILYASNDLILNQDGISNNSFPLYLPELEGLLISGNISDKKSGEPLRNEDITLSFVGNVALCQFTKTDERGDFNFVTRENGVREIVIQPLSSEINSCSVELKNPFISIFNNFKHGPFCLDSSRIGDINNAIISMQINNIYDPFAQHAINTSDIIVKPNFYGDPENTIHMSDYIELTSLKEVVKEIIPGVSTTKKNNEIDFKLIYQYPSLPFENSPLVLVDGVPVYDLDKVLNINSREIERIDVLSKRYFIADVVLDGILHFVSKRGNLGVIDFDRSVFRIEYELLHKKNDFYSPDYSSQSLKDNRIPDYRNTLYWNPDLQTDKTGKTSIEFYTSDESAEYIITVEGITTDGRTGVKSIPLIVKER